jgi:hypothetical protein
MAIHSEFSHEKNVIFYSYVSLQEGIYICIYCIYIDWTKYRNFPILTDKARVPVKSFFKQ